MNSSFNQHDHGPVISLKKVVPPSPPQPHPVTPPAPPHPTKTKTARKRPRRGAIVGFVTLIALAGIVYYISQSHTRISEPTPAVETTPHPKTPATTVSLSDAREVLAKVGQHMLLPEGETPTIATVSDLAALAGQEFFKNAQVGDIVLMFAKSRRAILYSPTQDKIIEVAPITTDMQKP